MTNYSVLPTHSTLTIGYTPQEHLAFEEGKQAYNLFGAWARDLQVYKDAQLQIAYLDGFDLAQAAAKVGAND
jgi:hypothetical protein